MASKKKILISLIVILILIIIFSIFFNKSSETVLETYTLNQQGLMKNNEIILDEKFDEKGNLIYYKYKSPDNNDILEFNFKYEYDDKNRIVKISLDNNDYIQITYDENNKISKIYENISDFSSNGRVNFEFLFNYLDNNEIVVEKNITYPNTSENEYNQYYTLKYKTINYNDKECILLTETHDKTIINEILYEKGSEYIDYSNFYNLINIVPLGYSAENNKIKNTVINTNSLLMSYPVFYNGNIIYSKNYIKTQDANSKTNIVNNYYDKSDRLLKQESTGYETNQTINCMYKTINSKEYYEYQLIKNYTNTLTTYTYIQNKIYLDDNNTICKKEFLKSNELTDKKYNNELKKFEKYFEKENK